MTKVERKGNLSKSEWAVLQLCVRHGDVGMSITKDALGLAIGKSVRTVDRVVRTLAASGYIEVCPQRSENGTTLPNLYKATPDGAERCREGRRESSR